MEYMKGRGAAMPLEISAQEYAHLLHTFTITPPKLRLWTMFDLILRQLLDQLDPDGQGIGVTIALCVPPPSGSRVRSLRVVFGKGTGPWQPYLGRRTRFLGVESCAGYALGTGRTIVIHDSVQQAQMCPKSYPPLTQSAVTSPLRRFSSVAGVLNVFSLQKHYFVQDRLHLVEQYAHLLAAMLDAEFFYALETIDLCPLPTPLEQQQEIRRFRGDVKLKIQQATLARRSLTILQAEELVWQEIEEKLIRRVLAH